MSRILGIVGSPRRGGNTDILVTEILKSAEQAGAESETIYLGDLTINECDGCHACWTGRDCTMFDDMNPLHHKIIESDLLVLGTPVYWYGPTGLMKCFIDRLVYFNCPENRTKIKGKKAVLAIPLEEEDSNVASLTVSLFEKILEYLEMSLAGTVIVPGVSAKGEVKNKSKALEKCHELGLRDLKFPALDA